MQQIDPALHSRGGNESVRYFMLQKRQDLIIFHNPLPTCMMQPILSSTGGINTVRKGLLFAVPSLRPGSYNQITAMLR